MQIEHCKGCDNIVDRPNGYECLLTGHPLESIDWCAEYANMSAAGMIENLITQEDIYVPTEIGDELRIILQQLNGEQA